MKLGAEPKKLAALGGLVAVALVVYFVNSGDSPPAQALRPTAGPAAVAVPMAATESSSVRVERKRPSGQASMGEFKPGIGTKRGEPKRDPTTIDPTLRLDLLAKVQSVQPESTMRNLFAFGAAQPTVKPLPELPKNVGMIKTGPIVPPGPVLPTVPTGPPQPPPPPPITFKYYGYKVTKGSGTRQAFLLDGEDIILAAENDLVKKRYRIIKMDAKSITIEDTQFKHSQTLPLQEDAVA